MKIYGFGNPQVFKMQFGDLVAFSIGEEGRNRRRELLPFVGTFDAGADDYEVSATKSGKPRIVRTGRSSPGTIARLQSGTGYRRNLETYVWAANCRYLDIVMVAHAWGRHGDAGNIGGWHDYVVIVPDRGDFLYSSTAGKHYVFIGRDRVIDRIDATPETEPILDALEEQTEWQVTRNGRKEFTQIIQLAEEGKIKVWQP